MLLKAFFVLISLLALFFAISKSQVLPLAKRYEKENVCPGTNIHLDTSLPYNRHYSTLRARYKNCKIVAGNLEIASILEKDLDFLQNIREVTGYVLFHDVHVGRVVLPNLEIIRGDTSFRLNPTDEVYALMVAYSNATRIEFPALKEIRNGCVHFFTSFKICNLDSIDWGEITKGENARVTIIHENVTELDCGECDNSTCVGGCWGEGPENCQKISRLNCSEDCSTGLCFGSEPEECCHSECLGGCKGPNSTDCFACKTVYDNGSCIEKCPDEKYTLGVICVPKCPHPYVVDENTTKCLTQCPVDKHAIDGKCVPVLPPAKKCTSPFNMWPGIHSGNIEYFRNCTILDGSIHIYNTSLSGSFAFRYNFTSRSTQPPLDPTSLEIFSTLKEVTGVIRITAGHKNFKELSFFRNLELLGTRNVLKTHRSLYISKTSLQSVSFKSLRMIFGDVEISRNNDLCYVDNINWKQITCTNFTVKVSNNGEKDKCQENGNVCDARCSSDGCWGSGSDDCLCSGYRFGDDRCLESCSEVGYVSDGKVCVESCPDNKFKEAGDCRKCHENCVGGCTGPQNTLGGLGCNSCEQLISFKNNKTIECMQRGENCPTGYYLASPNLRDRLDSRLQPGQPFCKLCHPSCKTCTGPGVHISVCEECVHYRKGDYCEEECQADYFPDKKAQECHHCAKECRGCTGPSSSDCKSCRVFRLCPDGIGNKTSTNLICALQCPPELPVIKSFGDNEDCCVPQPKSNAGMIAGLSIAGFLVAAGVCAGVCYVASHFLRKKPSKNVRRITQRELFSLSLYVTGAEPNMSVCRTINEEELKRDGILGSGAFGTVHKGIWMPEEDVKIPVAIKVLNGAAGAKLSNDFLNEAFLMAGVKHPNVLKLLAVCLSNELLLVTQLLPLGSLRDYLLTQKKNIGSQTMLNWCRQIAKGMQYLEEKRIVHRDLAARNVLVETPSLLKITDFGLAKLLDVDEEHYKAGKDKLPIKWLAIESLNNSIFTHKSDVWSFGVTAWEILTWGEKPYEKVPIMSIVQYLSKGQRLDQPSVCTLDLYMILLKTWMLEPNDRPTFTDLLDHFTHMSRDPGRYIVIPGDKFMRLPAYTAQDERNLLRTLVSRLDRSEEFLNAQEYLQRPKSHQSCGLEAPDGYILPSPQPAQLTHDEPSFSTFTSNRYADTPTST